MSNFFEKVDFTLGDFEAVQAANPGVSQRDIATLVAERMAEIQKQIAQGNKAVNLAFQEVERKDKPVTQREVLDIMHKYLMAGGGGGVGGSGSSGDSGDSVSIVDNADGTYTLTINGTDTVIDTVTPGDGTGTDDQTAAEVPFDNAASGLTATDVQAAIDELDGSIDDLQLVDQSLQDDITDIQGDVNNIQNDITNLQNNNTGTNTGDQNLYAQITADTGNVTPENTSTELRILGDGDITTSAQFDGAGGTPDTIQLDASALRTDIDQNASDITALDGRLTTAESGGGGGIAIPHLMSLKTDRLTSSSSAFATKGNIFVNGSREINITSVIVPQFLNAVGDTFTLTVALLDANDVITSVLAEEDFANGGSVGTTDVSNPYDITYSLASPATIPASARYAVVVTKTDSAATTALVVKFANGPAPRTSRDFSTIIGTRVADNGPLVVGTDLTFQGGSPTDGSFTHMMIQYYTT